MTITFTVLYFRGPLIIGYLPYDVLGVSVYDLHLLCFILGDH